MTINGGEEGREGRRKEGEGTNRLEGRLAHSALDRLSCLVGLESVKD